MKGFRFPALGLAVLAALASGAVWSQSDSLARGRAIFDKQGCQQCHSYVSRRGAPPVRDMLRDFEGDPSRVVKGIGAVAEHAAFLRGKPLSDRDLRLIAEWLGADFLPEDESDEPAEDKPPRPLLAADPAAAQAAVAAPAAVPAGVPATVSATGAAVPPTPAVAAKPAPALRGPAVSGVSLQSRGSAGDRLVIEVTGGEPDSIDTRLDGDRLVITLAGTGLSVGAPANVGPGASVVQSVDTVADGRSVRVVVSIRQGGLRYSAMQGRRGLTIDLSADPKLAAAARPASPTAAKPPAGSLAPSSAGPAAAAAAGRTGAAQASAATPTGQAAGKTEQKAPAKAATGTSTRGSAQPTDNASAVGPAGKPAESEKASPLAKAQAAEQAIADEQAAAARQAAEQARREKAEAAAQARAEAAAKAKAADETLAQKREADTRARREAEQREAAKPAVVAKAESLAEVREEGEKGKRRGSKRPYKEPNLGPCPPPNPADQVIGVVDVERAKDIMERIGCAQCHAYVQKKTGPPFREVLKKYKGDPACVVYRLKTNETHKDEGVTQDIRPDEFKILADYVATRMK